MKTDYRKYIRSIIRDHAAYKSLAGDVETQAVFDQERDHYQLLTIGWRDDTRVYHCIIHVDIKDDKIWIQ